MDGVLYHYTSRFHLPLILKDGFLKLTESNLRKPSRKEREEIERQLELIAQGELSPDYDSGKSLYKPVVWLTDVATPIPLGMETEGFNKHEIKIALRMQRHYESWDSWSKRQGIEVSWAKIIEKGYNADTWFVSERPIPLTAKELLKIENVITGEVMLDLEAGVRQYNCVVGPARGTMHIHFYNEWLGEHGLKKGDIVEVSL